MSRLGQSNKGIGAVVETISRVAAQTNLLALNAMIEAARAGEAGAGFAVVADEVKKLARQTADATVQITDRIAAIRDDTSRVVQTMARINAVVGQLSEESNSISAIVEQQTASTEGAARYIRCD